MSIINTIPDSDKIKKEEYKDSHYQSHAELIGFEFKLGNLIIDLWKNREGAEKESRNKLTEFLSRILLYQLFVVNFFVFLIGFGYLDINESIAKTFITGTFVELTALLGVVFAYIFKERKVEPLKIVLDLFEKISKHNNDFYEQYRDDTKENKEDINFEVQFTNSMNSDDDNENY